jgi:phosphatidylglycerophosphate synthase
MLYKRATAYGINLRTRKDLLFKPIVEFTPNWLTPNLVSSFRLIISFMLFYIWFMLRIVSVQLTWSYKLSYVLLIILGMITDLWDGALARYNKRNSFFGDIYDSIVDKIFILPITLLCIYLWPFMNSSLRFLFFFKMVAIILIVTKTLFHSNKSLFDFFQRIYFGLSTLGYSVLVLLLVKDIFRYIVGVN